MRTAFSLHFCHPWSGYCAMRGLRINIGTPRAFIIIGVLGGGLAAGRDGGSTWLSIEPPGDRRAT
jgi:hypothetical protein